MSALILLLPVQTTAQAHFHTSKLINQTSLGRPFRVTAKVILWHLEDPIFIQPIVRQLRRWYRRKLADTIKATYHMNTTQKLANVFADLAFLGDKQRFRRQRSCNDNQLRIPTATAMNSFLFRIQLIAIQKPQQKVERTEVPAEIINDCDFLPGVKVEPFQILSRDPVRTCAFTDLNSLASLPGTSFTMKPINSRRNLRLGAKLLSEDVINASTIAAIYVREHSHEISRALALSKSLFELTLTCCNRRNSAMAPSLNTFTVLNEIALLRTIDKVLFSSTFGGFTPSAAAQSS